MYGKRLFQTRSFLFNQIIESHTQHFILPENPDNTFSNQGGNSMFSETEIEMVRRIFRQIKEVLFLQLIKIHQNMLF